MHKSSDRIAVCLILIGLEIFMIFLKLTILPELTLVQMFMPLIIFAILNAICLIAFAILCIVVYKYEKLLDKRGQIKHNEED